MIIKTITKYVACDGREFDRKEYCIKYENKYLEEFSEQLNAVKVLKEFCEGKECDKCLFHSDIAVENSYCLFRHITPHLWNFYKRDEDE